MRKLTEHIQHLRQYRPSIPGVPKHARLLDALDFNALHKAASNLEVRILHLEEANANEREHNNLLTGRLSRTNEELVRLEGMIEILEREKAQLTIERDSANQRCEQAEKSLQAQIKEKKKRKRKEVPDEPTIESRDPGDDQ